MSKKDFCDFCVENSNIIRQSGPLQHKSHKTNQFFEKLSKYVSADFVAQHFGVSRRTVEGWTYRRLIPSIKINGKLVRYELEKIEQWITSQNVKEKL